jgi:hypothetical protein
MAKHLAAIGRRWDVSSCELFFQRIVKDASNNVRAALMALETEIMAKGV